MYTIPGLPLASFPGLPCFCSSFAFSIIHRSRRMVEAWKHLWREWHQVDVRWTLGGGGPHSNNVPDSTIEHFIARWDPKRSLDWEYSTSSVRNLLAGLLHTFLVWNHPPYVHLVSRHIIRVPRPFPWFFTALPLPCVIMNENQNMGRPRNETSIPLSFRVCPL